MRYVAPLLAVLLPLTLAAGKAAPAHAPDDLDPETRDLVIEKVAELIEETYIFPDIARTSPTICANATSVVPTTRSRMSGRWRAC